jgi:hypothetical protein
MDLHQLSHALFASLNATRRKLMPGTWPAISALHLIKNRLDVDQQCHITDPAAGLLPFAALDNGDSRWR